MYKEKLIERVKSVIEEHSFNGELTDGQVLDAIYDLMSWDDLANDEKIYCLSELLERVNEA